MSPDDFSIFHCVVGSHGSSSDGVDEDDFVVEMEAVFFHDGFDVSADVSVKSFLVSDVGHDDDGESVVFECLCSSCECVFEDLAE